MKTTKRSLDFLSMKPTKKNVAVRLLLGEVGYWVSENMPSTILA
jgi:hypothetical protein